MPVISLRWTLDADAVRETPDAPGVFTLWDGNECVYVGHTPRNTSLRDWVRQYLGLREAGEIAASRFAWEITAVARSRHAELVAKYTRRYGRSPRYNAVDDLRRVRKFGP